PVERFESVAGRLGRNTLQRDIFQQLVMTGPALLSNQLRSVFERRDKNRFNGRLRVASRIEPGSDRPHARCKTRRRRETSSDRRSLDQVDLQLVQVIECVADPDQSLFECAEIESFQGERLDQMLELPHSSARWCVSGALAREPAAQNVD